MSEGGSTAYLGVRLFDGSGGPMIDDALVLIAGDNIRYAGPRAAAPDLQGARQVDLAGGTLLPGLINSHIHLALDPYGPRRDWKRFAVDPTENTLYGYALARECLDHGVTTVGDLSAPHHGFITLARTLDQGILEGPRIVPVGRALVTSGGHSYSLGREVDGPIEAARAAREEIRAGAQQVKLMVEAGTLEGALQRQRLEMTREEMTAAIEAAHAHEVMVRVHAVSDGPTRAAIECGADVIEHGYALNDATLALMVERGIPLVPTVQVWKMALLNPTRVQDAVMLEHRRGVERAVADTLPRAIAAGVTIALGTDGSTMLNPAWRLDVELEALVAYGLSRSQALQSATVHAARAVGRPDLGRVAAGCRADLLVVDGDPTTDLAALTRIRLVVSRGHEVAGSAVTKLHTPRPGTRSLA